MHIKTNSILLTAISTLYLVGSQSLRAELRNDLMEVYETSDLSEVRPLIEAARKAGQPEGWYFSGRLAMLDFNFPQAQKDFAEYRRLAKLKKFTLFDYATTEALKGVKEGITQFDRFQDIVVIDAVKVPKKEFFKHLRLPLSAGRIVDVSEIPDDPEETGQSGFISEGGDFMMWNRMIAENDSVAPRPTMVEANVLTDGSVSEPHPIVNLGDDADYPFLTADGTTLYYSAYSDNSVGGRDIFIATRDPQTGSYRQPVNAGFPFNSAADDYLLAIDEENGVGWWATDRHLLDGEVVLYVFLLPEGRKNFEGSPEEKRERGKLDNIRVTWTSDPFEFSSKDNDDEDEVESEEVNEKTPEQLAREQEAREQSYEEKAAEIRKIRPGQKPRRHDCRIPIGPGKYIYSAEDLQSPHQRKLVEEYISLEKSYEALKSKLATARRQYSRLPSSVSVSEIALMEKEEERLRLECLTILSNLYREMGINK